MVMRGNCTFYEKVRLAQINGAKGILIVSKDRLVTPLRTISRLLFVVCACRDYIDFVSLSFVSFKLQTPPAGNKTQYEEIDIPVALLSYSDMLDISKVSGLKLILQSDSRNRCLYVSL